MKYVECNHPVTPYYIFPNKENEAAVEEDKKSNMRTLAVLCSNDKHYPHKQTRAEFSFLKSVTSGVNANAAFNDFISKAILVERDMMITKEIKKLNWQFWK